LVYRDFPLDGAALGAATVAHCAPRERYFAMVSLSSRRQDEWAVPEQWQRAPDQACRHRRHGQGVGRHMLRGYARKDAIVKSGRRCQAKYGINSTPTFIINGVKTSGAQPARTTSSRSSKRPAEVLDQNNKEARDGAVREAEADRFKSFVDPTELSIEPGVTGIVGPMAAASPTSLRRCAG
jgi:hypothetical protein